MSTTSVWNGTTEKPEWGKLTGDTAADVVVVGGGITGVTTAWLLSQAGLSVVLLEADAIGGRDTGNSTGNLYQTVSSGLHAVRQKWGDSVVTQVAQSRRHAVDFIEQRAATLGANCGFRRCPLFIYAGSQDASQHVQEELEAATAAGVPVLTQSSLPIGVPAPQGEVVVMQHQAQFHPLAYVLGLAGQAATAGAQLFEHSPVVELDRDKRVVRTSTGKVLARQIVLATHSPIGFHVVQAGMMAGREYGLAFAWRGSALPAGIYWAQGRDRLSVRGLDTPAGNYLIAVGVQHSPGNRDAQEALAELARRAKEQLGEEEPAFRWSGQHFHSPDCLPYIGRDASGAFIATGFGTDGLVYGTLAALMINEEIQGKSSRWRDLYKPGRFDPVKAGKGFVEETTLTMKTLVRDHLAPRQHEALEQLKPGHGEIVELDGEPVAAYRGADGSVQVVSAVCTHLKCRVHWNSLETSWDCPCHGSRFAPDGRVLEGPALRPLRAIRPPRSSTY